MSCEIYVSGASAESLFLALNPRIAPGLTTSEVGGKADILIKFGARCPLSDALSPSI